MEFNVKAKYLNCALLMLDFLKNYNSGQINGKQFIKHIQNKNNQYSSSMIHNALRELLRFHVLIRRKNSYDIDNSKIKDAINHIIHFKKLNKDKDVIINNISNKNLFYRKKLDQTLFNYSLVDIDHLIIDLLKKGYIKKFPNENSRGKYIVQLQTNDIITDPITAILTIYNNAVFCYSTAMEMHGLSRYRMGSIIYIKRIEEKTNLKEYPYNIKIKPVSLIKPDIGIIKINRKNSNIYCTDQERTLIDCVYRHKYAGGWENIIYALNKIEKVDEKKIVQYLKEFRIPSLSAKMGFILDANKEKWNISQSSLVVLKQISPSNPVHFFRNISGKLNKKWNLYIPDNILIE